MTSQAILGLWIIGLFLLVCVGEAVAIVVFAYKLGTCKGKLARYELLERQSSGGQREL